MSTLPRVVRAQDNTKKLVDWCLDNIGIGYHPDTRAADYIDRAGQPTFTEAQAKELDRLHNEAFDAGFGDLMYEYGLEGLHARVAHQPWAKA